MDLFTEPWQLVWVQERIFKDEPRLRHIGNCVKSRGGVLTCKRKAAQFACWAAEHCELSLPFIMVTDWREAQPSATALGEHDMARERLLMMVVVCDSPAQAKRARAWALKPETRELLGRRVHIVAAGNISDLLLGGLIRDCFLPALTAHSDAPSPTKAEADTTTLEALQPWRISLEEVALASDLDTRGHLGADAMEAPWYVDFDKLRSSLGDDIPMCSPASIRTCATGRPPSPPMKGTSGSGEF
mmetsp:Transcript_23439/g.67161  ORF Transcript_23439/g.67161 Transcript_23439/m.67161 type:complete len:244 (+) Transcript_23439:126-857(+)